MVCRMSGKPCSIAAEEQYFEVVSGRHVSEKIIWADKSLIANGLQDVVGRLNNIPRSSLADTSPKKSFGPISITV